MTWPSTTVTIRFQHVHSKCVLVQDPLSNAVARAKELEAACQNVQVQMVDAGHCPHDEVPHIVNAELLSFMQTIVGREEMPLDMPEAVSASA